MTAPSREQLPSGALLPYAEARLDGYLADLAGLVAIDSGSYSPIGVNRMADWTQNRLLRLGFAVERVALEPAHGNPVGDMIVARKPGDLPVEQGGRRLLLVAHLDTVFDDGAAAARPFHLDGHTARGPGVSDDKAGLLAGITALEILEETRTGQYAELVFLATPDEEIGSPASRPVTEAAARDAHFALALECARENGDLVIARKGVADFRVSVTGRAAHAGIEPERGANAALAAAHLVVSLQSLNGHWDDVTVNVGVVRAGSRTNIVCAEAELRVEVRSATAAGLAAAHRAIESAAARPAVAGTTATVERLDLCPPMEDTPASRQMFDRARRMAAGLGISLGGAATGGVGDANFIAGLGVPTLDGLGPVGGADHTPEEWLDTSTVPARVALLASLVAGLGDSRTS